MNFSTILLYAHSGVRWLVVLAAFIALILFGYGWLAKKEFPKLGRIVPSVYSGLLDAQVALGLIYMLVLVARGMGLPRFRLEHMTVLLFAAVVAHLPGRWRKKGSENLYRNTFLAILGSLVLIYLGVAILPGGWNR